MNMRLWMVCGLIVCLGCGDDSSSSDGGQDGHVSGDSQVIVDADSFDSSDSQDLPDTSNVPDSSDSQDATGRCLSEDRTVALAGGAHAIAIDDDLALVASGAVIAFRLPSGEELGRVPLNAVEVLARGGRLIANDGVDALSLALSSEGLEIVGRVDISGEASIALDADRLVSFRHPLEARIAALEITSLADLNAPQRLGSTAVTGKMPAHVVTSENHAFMVDPEQGLSIVDFSDVGAPQTVAAVGAGGVTLESRVATAGRFVYVGSSGGVLAFDVQDVASPAPAGQFRGGALIAIRGDLIASATATELIILRLDDMGGADELESFPITALSAIAWTEDGLWLGHADGLTTMNWNCP